MIQARPHKARALDTGHGRELSTDGVFQAMCQYWTPAVRSDAVLQHSGDVLVFVRCHVEMLPLLLMSTVWMRNY